MDKTLLQEITRILTEFSGAKLSAQVQSVQGPVQEGSKYRWRIISNRYKEVTVIASTRKPLFGKPSLSGIEVFGLGSSQAFKPNPKDLQDFLATAELVPVR